MEILRGVIGMFSIILLAVAFSKSRSSINWKLVGTGLAIQIILALFILKGSVLEQYWSPLGWPKIFFSWVSSFFVIVLDLMTATIAGMLF